MERDKKDPIDEFLNIFMSDQAGTAMMKMKSDLKWEPPVDIVETDSEIIVIVEVAGMVGKDIDVVTDGKNLKISGLRKNLCPPGGKQFHAVEIQIGHFEREIKLPVQVNHKKISAHYRNGILEIRVKKLHERDTVKKIRID